ncbi:MAG: NUDIX hydrolase [Acidiferrobacterales bacterium]
MIERNLVPRPVVATDVVMFTIRDRQLKLLLVRRAIEPDLGKWVLPGGFVRVDENLEDCARRELIEQTGVSDLYLEQLYTFGQVKRDPRERVVAVAYYALVSPDKADLRPAAGNTETGWFSLDELPALAFDHSEIVTMAYRRLVAKLDYSTIVFTLMPEKFTLSDLQAVYEIILEKNLDKRNFRKWVHALGRIEDACEERRDGQSRPARLYRVNEPASVEIIR